MRLCTTYIYIHACISPYIKSKFRIRIFEKVILKLENWHVKFHSVPHAIYRSIKQLKLQKNNKWTKILNLSPLEQKIHSFNTFYITEYTNTYKHVLKRLLHLSFKTFYFTPCVPRVSRLNFLLFDVLSYCLPHKILLHDVPQNIPLLLPRSLPQFVQNIYITGIWAIRLIYHRIYIKNGAPRIKVLVSNPKMYTKWMYMKWTNFLSFFKSC